MVAHGFAFATLALLLVAAAAARHHSGHTARRGGRARAAHHRSGKPVRGPASGELPLVTLKATNLIEFDFGDDGTLEKQLKDNGRYDPHMVVPFDFALDNDQRGHIILTTPCMRRGIPVTLSTIPYDGEVNNPRPKPYPNMEIQRTTEDTITDCNTQLVDVIRVQKTWSDDDTLYALDNGVLDMTTSPKHVCPPKIVIIDLRSDKVTSTTTIENAACNSMYSSLWVDACPDGSLTAYSGDSRGNVLTVTDLSTGTSKHLQSQYFLPKPGFLIIEAGGPATYIRDGICGVTAGQSCDGKLYFQAFASNVQGAVDKQLIRDASDGDVLDTKTQVDLAGKLSGPSGTMLVGPSGEYLFFPILEENAIYCWNTSKPHKNFHLLAQDNQSLQFVSSIRIEKSIRRLYMMSNRFTSYLSNTTNYSEDNYRIVYIDVGDTVC